MKPKTIILTGLGINCNQETEYAFELAGSGTEQVHVNEVIDGSKKLSDYQILAFPGGFLHGDAIAAGMIMKSILKSSMYDDVREFISSGKPVIGICNGFQVLVKSGLLPGRKKDGGKQTVTLTYNDSGRFRDDWVYLKNLSDKCIWTKDIKSIYLPIRHGEGKFVPSNGMTKELYKEDLVVFKYTGPLGEEDPGFPWNPNGSVDDVAGICNPEGNVLGMMPHPEGYIFRTQHPRWTREDLPEKGMGLKIIRNGVDYASSM